MLMQLHYPVLCLALSLVVSHSQAADPPLLPAHQSTYQPKQELKDCNVCPALVVVPPGSFMMGSLENEDDRENDESPQHQVNINYSLAVGKYQVTFAEWDACVKAKGCKYRPPDAGWGRGNRPVINVSWNDAQKYVRWLKQKTGNSYRLLSESEWEYVVRAGTSTIFATGNTITTDQANFNGDYTYNSSSKGVYRQQTTPVGSFAPNSFGLYDLHGNVREWVEDCYQLNYNDTPVDGAAMKSNFCPLRVLRGGSWIDGPRNLRSADRGYSIRDDRFRYGGFRLSRTLP